MNYGKFASAEELLKGYNMLEKAFTQKCQQLSALEKAANAEKKSTKQDTASVENVATSETMPNTAVEVAAENTEAKQPSENSPDDTANVTEPNLENGDSANVAEPREVSTAKLSANKNFQNAGDSEARRSAEFGWPTAEEVEALLNAASAKSDSEKSSENNIANAATSPEASAINDGINAEASPSGKTGQSVTIDSAVTVPQRGTDAQPSLNGLALVQPTDEQLQQYLQNNPSVVWKLLRQSASEAPSLMSGGGNVSPVLPSRPKTIKEASLMAKQLFR